MSSSSGDRWAILGGGLMGMTLALRLAEAGRHVSLFEAGPRLGGLASPHTFGEVTWDRFYHVVLSSDTRTRALVDSLGLASRLRFKATRTGLRIGGHLRSVSSPLELLTCAEIPLRAKVGLVRAVLAARRPGELNSLDSETAMSWLTRHSGEAAVETIWRPLLRSKLGEAAESASALFIWSTLRRLYGSDRARSGSLQFGYVEGGYAVVLDALERRLESLGTSIRRNSPIARVHRDRRGLVVSGTGNESERFDRVILTLPDPAVARIATDLNEAEKNRLCSTTYFGVVCVSLLVERQVTPFYVTNLTDTSVPFTGIIEMSNLVDRDAFNGRHLVYLPLYTDASSSLFRQEDARTVAAFVDALMHVVPGFSREQVVASSVSRAPHVLAVPTTGRIHRIAGVRTSVPGLSIVNGAQILDGTLNVNETIRHAERSLPEIIGSSPPSA